MPGERNRIVGTRMNTGGLQTTVLHDEGAPVTAAGGCVQVDTLPAGRGDIAEVTALVHTANPTTLYVARWRIKL